MPKIYRFKPDYIVKPWLSIKESLAYSKTSERKFCKVVGTALAVDAIIIELANDPIDSNSSDIYIKVSIGSCAVYLTKSDAANIIKRIKELSSYL